MLIAKYQVTKPSGGLGPLLPLPTLMLQPSNP